MCNCCPFKCWWRHCDPKPAPPKKPTPFFQWHDAREEQPRPGFLVLGQCLDQMHIVSYDWDKWYRLYDKVPLIVNRWADLTYLRSLVGTEPMFSKDFVFGKSEFADPKEGNER